MPRLFLSRNIEADTRRAQTLSAHAEQLGELRAAMGAQREEHQATVAALEAEFQSVCLEHAQALEQVCDSV
jgi:hypothetical protein